LQKQYNREKTMLALFMMTLAVNGGLYLGTIVYSAIKAGALDI
jgi:hypothetical protein